MTEARELLKKRKEELEKQVKELERMDKELWEEERKIIRKSMEDKLNYEIIVEPPDKDLWDTSEVFNMRIREFVHTANLSVDENLIYESDNYPHNSVTYIVSRKLKKIIGTGGGGYIMLGKDYMIHGDNFMYSERKETQEKLKKVIDEFLNGL